jgi:hypothetical protein
MDTKDIGGRPEGMRDESGVAGYPRTEETGATTRAQGVEAIPEAFAFAVDQTIHDLQPKIHEAVNDLTEKAVRLSNQAAQNLAARVRRNPWYVAGGVALLFVGLAVAFGLENRREQRIMEPDLH